MNRLRSIPFTVVLLLAAVLTLLAAGSLLAFLLLSGGGSARPVVPAALTSTRATPALSAAPTLAPLATATSPLSPWPPTATLAATPTADRPADSPSATPTSVSPVAEAAPSFPLPVDEGEVEAILAGLTLEEKVGQMLMVGLPGPALDDVAWRRVVQQGVGGVIFLDRNASNPEQTRAFTQALQNAAIQQGPGLPLLIGWNHEGGTVARREAGLTHFPSAMALGAADRPDLVQAIGQAVAVEMRSLGVNVNYAPVLDVNVEPANPVIGLRSFGNTPQVVADAGSRYIRGQQGAGVIAVAKHFPGHGGVDVDSHVALPVVEASLDSLRRVELPPFQAAVDSNVAAVMVAHLRIPAVDPSGAPSSVSPPVVSGILREEMGYDGVVMTDDMGMQAIRDHYTLSEAAVLAVLAGNDLLLAVETARDPDEMRNALLDAVAAGRLNESRIDASVRRLIRLKLAYDLAAPPDSVLLENGPAHDELAREAGTAAVTPVKDTAGWLPLPLPTQRLLLITPANINPGTEVGDGQSLLHEILISQGVSVEELFYDPYDPADVARVQADALSRSATVDAIVVVTWDAILRYAHHGETAQEQLVNRLLDTGRTVAVVFGRLPYDRQRVPNAPTQIAIFGDTGGQLEGLASLLLGFSPLTNSRN